MNIATLTPVQAGLETDHDLLDLLDLLEFESKAKPRRLRKHAHRAYNFKSAEFENFKPQIT